MLRRQKSEVGSRTSESLAPPRLTLVRPDAASQREAGDFRFPEQGGESIQEATASSVMPSTAAAVRGRLRTSNFPGTHPMTAIPKAIIYAWVNDETTLRKAGSRTDPYVIFNRRLRDGDPPDDWHDLVQDRFGFRRRRMGPV